MSASSELARAEIGAISAAHASVLGRTPYVALDFTQQSDVVKIPSVNVTGAATFAVWIKPLKSTPLG